MKKRNFFKSILLGALGLLTLTGCGGQTVEATCYFFENGQQLFGDFASKMQMSVTKGVIDSLTIESTFSPSMWAQVDPAEKTDAEIETIDVTNSDLFEGTLHIAKYISFGTGDNSFACTGTLRDPDGDESALYYRGDYVHYDITAIGGKKVDLKVSELKSYLNTTEEDNNHKLGSSIKKYYDAVEAKDVHVLGHAKDAADKTVNDIDYTPHFPEGKVHRTELASFADWKTSTEAFETYLAGKKLDYIDKVIFTGKSYYSLKHETKSGFYQYNPYYATKGLTKDDLPEAETHWEVITGCKFKDVLDTAMSQYFVSANTAFAYVEYDSVR